MNRYYIFQLYISIISLLILRYFKLGSSKKGRNIQLPAVRVQCDY